MRHRWAIICAAVLFGAGQAHAQSNFEGAQIGGRTAMMGGAAVASGADEATAFMNPAGITKIPGQSFSFSTFAVQTGNRTIQNALDPSGNLELRSTDAGQIQLRIVPNTFCLFLNGPPKNSYSRRSRHKYAMCAAATERERLDVTDNRINSSFGGAGVAGAGHSTRMEFVRSTLALAWGLDLDSKTSLGVTWRVDNARMNDTTSASGFIDNAGLGRLQTLNLSRDAWSWDTSLVVGVTSNISKVVTLGAALTTPSQHLVGSYIGIASVSTSSDAPDGLAQDAGDFRYNHPGSLRMGLAFRWPRLTFEVNGSFYGPQKQRARANFDRITTIFDKEGGVDSTDARASVAERGKPVANLAAGMEFFVERDFSLLAGVQTDFSGLHKRQDQVATDVLFRQNKDTIHAALGVTSYGRRGRLLLGLRTHYSSGHALIADPTQPIPTFVSLPQTDWGLSLILSGRISFRAVRDTAVRAANPLLSPSLDPNERSDAKGAEEKP